MRFTTSLAGLIAEGELSMRFIGNTILAAAAVIALLGFGGIAVALGSIIVSTI